jgi:surface antigen
MKQIEKGPVLMVLLVLALPSLLSSQILEDDAWITYVDPDLEFSVQYPDHGWEMEMLLEDQQRGEFAMRRYVAFSGPQRARIGLGIWDNNEDLTLSEWFDKHHGPLLTESSQILRESHLTVSGSPALMLIQPADSNAPVSLYTIFRCRQAVFRIEYFAFDGGAAQDIYYQMISSFGCEGQHSITEGLPPLPLMPLEEALPADLWCCGHYDGCSTYPCCSDQGNCTWWAKYKRPDFPCGIPWGDAGPGWIIKAQEWGFPTGTTPLRGAVAVYPGHVAYVEEVYDNGTYRVSEMGWCRTCYDEVIRSGGEFIYCKCCCCPGLGLCSGESSGICSAAGGSTEEESSLEAEMSDEVLSVTDIEEPISISSTAGLLVPRALVRIPGQYELVRPQRIPPTSASYQIARSVFGSGGGAKASTNYVMNSTQGQATDLSRRQSASYVLVPGYWSRWIPSTFKYRIYLPLVVKGQ